MKFVKTIIDAKKPNAAIGMMDDNPVAKNAIQVVKFVANIVWTDLFHVYAILLCMSQAYIDPAYSHASAKTKKLSADIPRMMNTATICKAAK
jgi:hypothetical protein